jgi:hypothetical protein
MFFLTTNTCFAISKVNRLILFREIISVYSESYSEYINALCGQNVQFCSVVFI